jgi:two-component sensor histidine kinase
VLAEGLRNAHKHAKPSSVRVHVGRIDGAFLLEVRNDGTRQDGATRGAGMGLRLAAVEALQRGALVEFGPEGSDWRLRLVVPLEDDAEE